MQPEIIAIQRELKALRREVRRQRRRFWLIPLVALLALVPLVAQAANPFQDLNPGSPHNGNIDAIFNAGVTTGCVPLQRYCPSDNVTREEMASFLARIGGLGVNPAVVNAKTALIASNATQLGGRLPGAYQLAADPVANAINAQNATHATAADNATSAQNAMLLNGFAANGLVRTNANGSGLATFAVTGTYQPVASVTLTLPGPGLVFVTGIVSFQSAPGGGSQLSPVAAKLHDNTSGLEGYPEFAWVGNLAGSAVQQTIAPTWVFQATSGGLRSFVIEVSRDPTSLGSASAFNGVVSALYVPFGPGGALASEDGIPGGFDWPPTAQP